MESLICALGSVSFAFSLSEDEVQRDTQLCVDHAMMAVNVSNMIAILFFLSFLAILNLMMFLQLRLAKILQRDELAKKIKLNIYKHDRFIRILCTFAPE